MKKLRVGVIYGGRSGEHEVSIASAAAIFKHLDPARYDAVPIKIAKDGRWALGTTTPKALSAADVHKQAATEALVPVDPSAALQGSRVDVVFPVLHGPYGEDGTVQGLLELANVPYVGAGVLGSAVGMDKAVMKALFAAANLPIVPHLTVLRRDWERAPADITGAVARDLRYPVFVKPANLGSSVGISKARLGRQPWPTPCGSPSISTARWSSRRACPTRARSSARCWATTTPRRRCPARSSSRTPTASTRMPRSTSTPTARRGRSRPTSRPRPRRMVRRLSVQAFKALELAGMARVDFFLGRQSGAVFLNEVNTIPGFTTISMYPKMWEATGLPLSGAARPADRARARAPRREAAAAHQRDMTASCASTDEHASPRLCRRGRRRRRWRPPPGAGPAQRSAPAPG